MRSVRLYGKLRDFGSHARVTRGFMSALEPAGLLAGVVPVENEPDDEEAIGGARAPAAAFTGPLGLLMRMKVGAQHGRRYVMVAPNSNRIPPSLAQSLLTYATDVLVPSQWAAGVMQEFFQGPVHVVPHGVDPEFRVMPEIHEETRARYREQFRVLHLASSGRQRKGTHELVEAWLMLKRTRSLPTTATLSMVLDPEAMGIALQLTELGCVLESRHGCCMDAQHNIWLINRMNLDSAALARAYQAHHVVCQPSRGEAFGLCPLEALACGVPAVLTHCTGHTEYLGGSALRGAVLISTGPDEPLDDLPGSVGPTVRPDSVALALSRAFEDWDALNYDACAAAEAVATEWSWHNQLSRWMDHLRKELQSDRAT